MYVDVTNILKETGFTVEEWATHIRNEITQATGCPCSTGIFYCSLLFNLFVIGIFQQLDVRQKVCTIQKFF